MAIDTSGTWWVGSQASDLAEYLRAYSEDSYPVDEARLAACECGGATFRLEYRVKGGAARRTCVACGVRRFIADSEGRWAARPKQLKCVGCRSPEFNIGVGFSLHGGRQAVRWVYVAARCVGCGVLGCCVEWKIGYEPSLHLLDQA